MRYLSIVYLILLPFFSYSQPNIYKGGSIFGHYLHYSVLRQAHLYFVWSEFFYAPNSTFDFPQFHIFDAATGNFIKTVNSYPRSTWISGMAKSNPCLSGKKFKQFYNSIYCIPDFSNMPGIPLPNSSTGFIATYQVCCQHRDLVNAITNANQGVVSYTYLPPNENSEDYIKYNSHPVFKSTEDSIICANTYFEIDYFTTTNVDNDSLSFSFVPAYQIDINKPPTPPPYDTVTYLPLYSGGRPLGDKVSINPKTGVVSGITPSVVGDYLVAVQVNEYRNGALLTTNRKELVIGVEDCQRVRFITLPKEYLLCDSRQPVFNHTNKSPLINSLHWQFGDGDSSTVYNPMHTYKDTGTYTLKLWANKGQICSDSAYTTVKIYPSPQAGFGAKNNCFTEPVQFSDSTLALAGNINAYHWLFGDSSAANDTSTIQHPSWQYNKAGDKTITLIVNNDKGCADTLQKTISLAGKPLLQMPFKDTTICLNSSLLLQPNSPAQNFSWQPATSLSHPNSLHTTASPATTTTYTLAAGSGDCVAVDSLRIVVKAPPRANAGSLQTICTGQSVALQGSTQAHVYYWQPHPSLSDAQSLQPTATPAQTTQYILQAYDTAICLNPASDTVTIAVLPPVVANAGNDTTITRGQSMQLHAKGGDRYEWLPPKFINQPDSPNPVLTITDNIDSIRYYLIAYNQAGCADTASILIQLKAEDTAVEEPKVEEPVLEEPKAEEPVVGEPAVEEPRVRNRPPVGIFIPSAFTPNGDGLNDYFYPIGSELQNIKSFKIYNRWGQQVYTAQGLQKGWDGRLRGKPLASDVYVWMINVVDTTGKPLQKSGLFTLVR